MPSKRPPPPAVPTGAPASAISRLAAPSAVDSSTTTIVESSNSPTVESSTARRVHSYKIGDETARRVRKLAHAWDRPIGEVAERAFLAYLAEMEGKDAPE